MKLNEEITLLHGDCHELMAEMPEHCCDAVFTDPPYGCTRNNWDSPIDLCRIWKQYRRIIKPRGVIIIFAQGMFTAKLMLSNPMW